jgi:Domain of unknown function (DUF1929)
MHTPNIFEIDAVSLVRHPNTIHHYDRDTRLVRLQIPTQSSGSIIVSVPINSNIAPPGYIYIYILSTVYPAVRNIPSVATTLKIPR